MELHGEIAPEAPLIVVAVHEESEPLKPLGLPMLITGAGKVNAAVATATMLSTVKPTEVVNLGTAGALVDGLSGTHQIGGVVQHDLDDEALLALTGISFGPPISLGEGPILATGDVFVSDPQLRAVLARDAQLVDMEGYGIARAAAAAGVPVRLIKTVSDSSDDAAARSWKDTVAECAEQLAEWARLHLVGEAAAQQA